MILREEKGQVVILMLLVMVIALAIALSLISRSNIEVSTSRKSEDSSRAFSAAEASIERAINANTATLGSNPSAVTDISFGNQVGAKVDSSGLPTAGKAMEYPPFGKEAFAQFWLANPLSLAQEYTGSFELYFGVPKDYSSKPDDQPGIEATVITFDTGMYKSYQYYFDSISVNQALIAGGRSNGFYGCASRCTNPLGCPGNTVDTNNNPTSSKFYCRVVVPATFGGKPVMVRVRILFTNSAQPVALKPITTGKSLPVQLNIYRSIGTSGNVRRTLEVFQQKSVMPQIFDFVLFSAQTLNK